jgi:hypothetical protein
MVRWASHSSVNLVLSDDGKPKFEIEEVEPSKKRGYLTKKRLKLQRKREKKKRKEANINDPRRIRPKGKKIKQKFPTPEARLKYKIEKVCLFTYLLNLVCSTSFLLKQSLQSMNQIKHLSFRVGHCWLPFSI